MLSSEWALVLLTRRLISGPPWTTALRQTPVVEDGFISWCILAYCMAIQPQPSFVTQHWAGHGLQCWPGLVISLWSRHLWVSIRVCCGHHRSSVPTQPAPSSGPAWCSQPSHLNSSLGASPHIVAQLLQTDHPLHPQHAAVPPQQLASILAACSYIFVQPGPGQSQGHS